MGRDHDEKDPRGAAARVQPQPSEPEDGNPNKPGQVQEDSPYIVLTRLDFYSFDDLSEQRKIEMINTLIQQGETTIDIDRAVGGYQAVDKGVRKAAFKSLKTALKLLDRVEAAMVGERTEKVNSRGKPSEYQDLFVRAVSRVAELSGFFHCLYNAEDWDDYIFFSNKFESAIKSGVPINIKALPIMQYMMAMNYFECTHSRLTIGPALERELPSKSRVYDYSGKKSQMKNEKTHITVDQALPWLRSCSKNRTFSGGERSVCEVAIMYLEYALKGSRKDNLYEGAPAAAAAAAQVAAPSPAAAASSPSEN